MGELWAVDAAERAEKQAQDYVITVLEDVIAEADSTRVE